MCISCRSYFCDADDQCPGGFSCQMGLCSVTDCGPRSSKSSALTCNLRDCLPGWSDAVFACLKPCPSNEVNVGVACASCGAREFQAGLCYDRCAGGYDAVGPTCWGRW